MLESSHFMTMYTLYMEFKQDKFCITISSGKVTV